MNLDIMWPNRNNYHYVLTGLIFDGTILSWTLSSLLWTLGTMICVVSQYGEYSYDASCTQ